VSIEATRFLDSGVLCSRVARQAGLIFEAIEKSGLHGREPGKSRVVRHQHIHDPGIQQEPPGLSEVAQAANGQLHVCMAGLCYDTLHVEAILFATSQRH
jgi:hypothetical protein